MKITTTLTNIVSLVAISRVSDVSGQCTGCADTTSCHVFDSGNDKFLGCYGTFSGGASGLSALCGTGFVVPTASEASSLGFTQTMCETAPSNTFFFIDEAGVGLYCNTAFGTTDPKGLWGCGTGGSTAFENYCSDTGNVCSSVTSWRCEGASYSQNGTTIMTATVDNEYNTLALLDANYGGALCIRSPTSAPTNMPTLVPTNPTMMPTAPTLVPTTPTVAPTAPTKTPTAAPTDGVTGINCFENIRILVFVVICMVLYQNY